MSLNQINICDVFLLVWNILIVHAFIDIMEPHKRFIYVCKLYSELN